MDNSFLQVRHLLIFLVLTTVLLTGCATNLKPQPFDKEKHQNIQTIVVLEMPKVETTVVMLNHPGTNFGLIGGLIAAADISSMSAKLQETMRREGFDPVLYLRQQLISDMAKHGRTLIWPEPMFEVKSASRKDGLRKQYSTVSNADAQLDLSISYLGYVAAGAGKEAPYRPSLSVKARLVSADGKESYYYDFIVYNNAWMTKGVVTIEPDPKFAYPKFSDLQKAGPSSVDGIKHAIDAVASELVDQL